MQARFTDLFWSYLHTSFQAAVVINDSSCIHTVPMCKETSRLPFGDEREILDRNKAVAMCLCAGNIGDVLYGASLIPNLQQLFLANQSFSGSLPTSNLAMPALEEMDLSNNHIEARTHVPTYIPLYWILLGPYCVLALVYKILLLASPTV